MNMKIMVTNIKKLFASAEETNLNKAAEEPHYHP